MRTCARSFASRAGGAASSSRARERHHLRAWRAPPRATFASMGTRDANDANGDAVCAASSRDGATARVSSRPSSRIKGEDTPMHGLTGMDHPSMKPRVVSPRGMGVASGGRGGRRRPRVRLRGRRAPRRHALQRAHVGPRLAGEVLRRSSLERRRRLRPRRRPRHRRSRQPDSARGCRDCRRRRRLRPAADNSAPAALAPAGVCPGPGVTLNARAPTPRSLKQTWQTPQTHVPRPSGVLRSRVCGLGVVPERRALHGRRRVVVVWENIPSPPRCRWRSRPRSRASHPDRFRPRGERIRACTAPRSACRFGPSATSKTRRRFRV